MLAADDRARVVRLGAAAIGVVGVVAVAARASWFLTASSYREAGYVGATVTGIVVGFIVIALAGARWRYAAAAIAAVGAVVWLAKPLLWPMRYDGHALSLTAETHLYFVIPGGLMALAALLLVLLPKPAHDVPGRGGAAIVAAAATAAGVWMVLIYIGGRGPRGADLYMSLFPGLFMLVVGLAVFARGVVPASPPQPFAPPMPPYRMPAPPIASWTPPHISSSTGSPIPHGFNAPAGLTPTAFNAPAGVNAQAGSPPNAFNAPAGVPPTAFNAPAGASPNAFNAPAGANMPSHATGLSGYATDPSMQSLLAAVAQAPQLDATPWLGGGQPTLVGQRFGHFEVIELLGRGGMGRVYRTRDHRLLRDVALKLLPWEASHDAARRERLLREAQAAARVVHPNVTTIYELSPDGPVPFIAMELVPGRTLRARLREGPITPDELHSILMQIADGLAAAHAQGLVHRDLKPDNVMLTPDGIAKILDFGLAFETDRNEQQEPNKLAGTPAYMSPEQARGERVDTRSDIFAFGAVLYELAVGQPLFAQPDREQVRHAIAHGLLPEDWQTRLQEPLRSIAHACVMVDPTQRLSDGAALAQTLRTALHSPH